MDFDRDPTDTDEYSVTASQIFDYCGVDKSGVLHVDSLMEKFAPFVRTNKAEFSCLKNLLDPDESNPEINVTKLASTLHKYSESQKTKIDLDESFNLRNGQAPQDSDSGISSDGLQLIEVLQCELKEKELLAQKLRSQLDYIDRHHEETIAGLIAERDALKKTLNMVREENSSLSAVRSEYEEAAERAAAAESARGRLARERDAARRRAAAHADLVTALEGDKVTLQELLSKSKDECHRINEMYASRQSFLLEQNEALMAERAQLAARVQDFEDYTQQILKEKLLVETELKECMGRCNAPDRSVDVSCCDDGALSQLDSLTADSRFATENQILDEDSFLNVLKEDQGRATNISLFDEIRLSFCNRSRLNFTDNNHCERCNMNNSFLTIGTQTDEDFKEFKPCTESEKVQNRTTETQTDLTFTADELNSQIKSLTSIETQTDDYEPKVVEKKVEISSTSTQTDVVKVADVGFQTIGSLLERHIVRVARRTETKALKSMDTVETQTDEIEPCCNNNNVDFGPCYECEKAHTCIANLENKIATYEALFSDMENNLDHLQKLADDEKSKKVSLENLIDSFKAKVDFLEAACEAQSGVFDRMLPETCCAACQTEIDQNSVSTQVETACADCEKRNAVAPHRSLKKFFWETVKCLFQMFAVVCFVCAVSVLYGVSRRAPAACAPRAAGVPWRWLSAQDLMDLLLRIEYTADVPM